MNIPQTCSLCPRRCGANRTLAPGICHGGAVPLVARAAPHHWEEPCLSGTKGSGTVFFAGCGLGCVFCQNHTISRGGGDAGVSPNKAATPQSKAAAPPSKTGTPQDVPQLAQTFLSLQAQGVHNLNLVTATHYLPWVVDALALAKTRGLTLPVVWNTGGYETTQTVAALKGYVDIWLFDVKFHAPQLARKLANAPDYFETATAALTLAQKQTGPPLMGEGGLLRKGVMVRVLVLPGAAQDAIHTLEWLAANLPCGGFLLCLMSQYTPPSGLALPAPMNRRLSTYEYRKVCDAALALGLTNGYVQDRESARESYVPPFGTNSIQPPT